MPITPSYTKATLDSMPPGQKFDSKACKEKLPTPAQFAQDSGKILKSMGMGNKCKQTADHAYQYGYGEQHSSSKAAFVAGGLWGVVGGAMAHDQGSTNIGVNDSDSKTSEGCSQVMSNIAKQMANMNNITCTMNQSSSKSGVQMSSSSTITIDSTPTDIQRKIIKDKLEAIKLVKPGPPMKVDPIDYSNITSKLGLEMAHKDHQDDIKNARLFHMKELETYKELLQDISGSINITGSTIKNYVSGNAEVSKVNVKNVASKVKEDVKRVTTQAVEQHLQDHLGVNVNVPDMKQSTVNQVEDNTNSVDKAINNAEDQLEISITPDANIIIKSGGSNININDTTFDQHMEVTLKSKQVVKNAMETGKMLGMKLLNDYKTFSETGVAVKGQEEIMKQIAEQIKASGDAAAKATKAAAELSKAQGEFISDTIGSITSMFGMAILGPILMAMLPILIPFVLPMLGFGMIPRPLKYLLIGIGIYLLVAFFMGLWPFGSSEKYEIMRHERLIKEVDDLEEYLDHMLENFDYNNDGRISEEEFLKGASKEPELMFDVFDELQTSLHSHRGSKKMHKKKSGKAYRM